MFKGLALPTVACNRTYIDELLNTLKEVDISGEDQECFKTNLEEFIDDMAGDCNEQTYLQFLIENYSCRTKLELGCNLLCNYLFDKSFFESLNVIADFYHTYDTFYESILNVVNSWKDNKGKNKEDLITNINKIKDNMEDKKQFCDQLFAIAVWRSCKGYYDLIFTNTSMNVITPLQL